MLWMGWDRTETRLFLLAHKRFTCTLATRTSQRRRLRRTRTSHWYLIGWRTSRRSLMRCARPGSLPAGNPEAGRAPATSRSISWPPAALCGRGGRRSAHLQPPHEAKATARRTLGLEPAVVDNEIRLISALSPDDPRTFEIKVAGPAALVVSKVVKIAERREQQPHRLKPKDGLDVLRLLRAVDTASLADSLAGVASDELSSAVVAGAIEDLRDLAAGPEDLLPRPAADAEMGFSDPDEIKMSMVVLVGDLLQEFDHRSTPTSSPKGSSQQG
jgi:hypothetical protein